jgi:hypothetical protein
MLAVKAAKYFTMVCFKIGTRFVHSNSKETQLHISHAGVWVYQGFQQANGWDSFGICEGMCATLLSQWSY